MSGKQKMTWDGDANTKLLLSLLKGSDAKLDFDAVAKEASNLPCSTFIVSSLPKTTNILSLSPQLTTETTTCTPRAVQEQLKKLRKVAQGAEPGSTTASAKSTPVATPTKAKAARKAPAATPAGGVKKTRKPAAAGGRGKKAKAAAAAAVKAEHVDVKAEPGSDDDDGMDGSSDVGEGSAFASDQAQIGLEDEMFA